MSPLLLLALAVSATGVAAQLTERTMPSQKQSSRADSPEVNELLNQAKAQANQLKIDASDMESFTRSDVAWETQAIKINQVKGDVNAVSQTIAKMRDEEPMASEWQKMAIARTQPLLKELVANTTAVIEHLNRDRGRNLHTQEHKDMLQMNADLSSELSTVINDFINYGNTKNKFYALRQKLEVSETGSKQ
ncbi:MAG TPA: hypothetical protein VHN81_00200 [Edaphobacter sp.]|nr:hypothetical protein [Edaphobacter sp.]